MQCTGVNPGDGAQAARQIVLRAGMIRTKTKYPLDRSRFARVDNPILTV
jgi:hypothetical protein